MKKEYGNGVKPQTMTPDGPNLDYHFHKIIYF